LCQIFGLPWFVRPARIPNTPLDRTPTKVGQKIITWRNKSNLHVEQNSGKKKERQCRDYGTQIMSAKGTKAASGIQFCSKVY
jgi:hypothetical protein